MRPVVLVGHRHTCPMHGPGTVISGADGMMVNGRPVACVGDRVSCGAVIITGSPGFTVDGRAVAREGDHTDHGGTLIEGDGSWMVD